MVGGMVCVDESITSFLKVFKLVASNDRKGDKIIKR
jgi:hypothetical protein